MGLDLSGKNTILHNTLITIPVEDFIASGGLKQLRIPLHSYRGSHQNEGIPSTRASPGQSLDATAVSFLFVHSSCIACRILLWLYDLFVRSIGSLKDGFVASGTRPFR
jgi:hypothetical protein